MERPGPPGAVLKYSEDLRAVRGSGSTALAADET